MNRKKSSKRDPMEDLIKVLLRKRYFREVLREWALHVEVAAEEKVVDATTFANLYIEMMRDPRNAKARTGYAFFMVFIKPRKWEEVLEAFGKILSKDVRAAFEKPEAREFYKQFRFMILKQITEYWESFLIRKKRKSPRKRRVSVKR